MNRANLMLPLAIAIGLATAGCSPRSDQTVGQKMDHAIASAKVGAEEAKVAAAETADKVAVTATDAAITTKINAALAVDDKLKALRINVDTVKGRVVLKGAAPDAASRDRATTLAKAVDGVVVVDNMLTVDSKG